MVKLYDVTNPASDLQVLFLPNTHHTLKDKPGQRYETIWWYQIARLLRAPSSQPKTEAAAIICSELIDHDARSAAAQRERGSFWVLPHDIDSGNVELERVVATAKEIYGESCIFMAYSTASAGEADKKWRLLVPLAEPLHGRLYTAVMHRVMREWGQRGITLCPGTQNVKQIWYLPNVPPDRRRDGQPLFYQWHQEEGEECFALPGEWLTAAEREVEAVEAERAKHKPVKKGKMDSAIERYNESRFLEKELERFGYQHDGHGNWRSKYQTSGSYATRIFDDSWISLSASDAEAGLGAESDGGARFGDAFDLLVHYSYLGNAADALRAIRAELDNPGGWPRSKGSIQVYQSSDWIIRGYFPADESTQIVGQPGVGKSTALAPLGLVVAGYGAALGSDLIVRRPRKFLVVCEQPRQYERLLYKYCKEYNLNMNDVDERVPRFSSVKFGIEGIKKALTIFLEENPDPFVVCLDTQSSTFNLNDENANAELSKYIDVVKQVTQNSHATVWVISHGAKAIDGTEDNITGRGASAQLGDYQRKATIFRREELPGFTFLALNKARDEWPTTEIRFETELYPEENFNEYDQEMETNYLRLAVPMTARREDRLEQQQTAQAENANANLVALNASTEIRLRGYMEQATVGVLVTKSSGGPPHAEREGFVRVSKRELIGRSQADRVWNYLLDKYHPVDEGRYMRFDKDVWENWGSIGDRIT